MLHNGLRSHIEANRLTIGTMLFEFFTPGIGHILKNAGCDFAIADMEHSGIGFGDLRAVVRYFEAAGLPSVVRIPTSRSDDVSRAFDIGADAILIPMVGTALEAEDIVSAAKFHPRGQRGIAVQIGHDRFREMDFNENLAASNGRTAILVQIETVEGVRNADAIASVDGVDCLWLGHGDLSASLGTPGNFDTEEFKSAVDTITSAAKNNGKMSGRLVPDAEAARRAGAQGFQLIALSADVKLLHRALQDGVAAIKDA